MNISPIEYGASLRIGSIEFVSPDKIEVGLDLEAPGSIAANAGVPRAFPRINSYVLIATEEGHIVAQIEWIAVERAPFSKRKDFKDDGLVNLPFPLRKMQVNPLGLLKKKLNNEYEFHRGVQTFPSVGEPVLIPTDAQLKSIIEAGEKRRVKIGTSPLAANADVCIDPDKLFGRHLAVLGNTGSGKSCSVAGLIQWSLQDSKKALNKGSSEDSKEKSPNARFIILDPNGEYTKVFKGDSRVFRVGGTKVSLEGEDANVSPQGGDDNVPLQVPLWLWNSAEWISFTQASAKTQVPLLKQALRFMRNEEFEVKDDLEIKVRQFIKIILNTAILDNTSGTPYKGFPQTDNFIKRIEVWKGDIEKYKSQGAESLDSLIDNMDTFIKEHTKTSNSGHKSYPACSRIEMEALIEKLQKVHLLLGGKEQDILPKNEDIPIKFTGDVFINVLEALAQGAGNIQNVGFLLTRIRTMLADTRMKGIIGDSIDLTLKEWLESYIGSDNDKSASVTVIDLSLVPVEIIHIITSVIARMTFEALQRYHKSEGKSLPTVLVVEEAHTFIKRYKEDVENQNVALACTQVFEKIAREGRKFGLGLVLSSQRPSELSPTVLSQCNSFLLHRISNDRDQELVNRLVPDNFRGLLRELPSLPSQQAILLGWATELPIMVRINDLASGDRPHSDDPDFWDVWSRKSERTIDWGKIADEWQMKEAPDQQENAEGGSEL